jgi:Family of unknown function (DUF5678)
MVKSSDCEWLAEHGLELSARYPGKWVAVHEGRVIGVGANMLQAEREALALCPQHDFILEEIDVESDLPHVD